MIDTKSIIRLILLRSYYQTCINRRCKVITLHHIRTMYANMYVFMKLTFTSRSIITFNSCNNDHECYLFITHLLALNLSLIFWLLTYIFKKKYTTYWQAKKSESWWLEIVLSHIILFRLSYVCIKILFTSQIQT